MQEKLTTLLEILNYSADLLRKSGLKDPRLNVELILSKVLSCTRLKLYLDYDKPLRHEEIADFKSLLKRRLNHEPLQYILGTTNFYGYEISVNSSVLIPRPDTEMIVEKFLDYTEEKDNISVLEIGTGSGCIAVAVSGELIKKGINFRYVGIDIDERAASVARNNLLNNGIDGIVCTVVTKDFLSDDFSIQELEKQYNTEFTFIISNPPYISASEYKLLDKEVIDFEPAIALTDSRDGLVFYRKLLEIKKSCDAVFFIETAYNRKNELEKLLNNAGIVNYSFEKDYGGNFRVLIVD